MKVTSDDNCAISRTAQTTHMGGATPCEEERAGRLEESWLCLGTGESGQGREKKCIAGKEPVDALLYPRVFVDNLGSQDLPKLRVVHPRCPLLRTRRGRNAKAS